MTALSDSVICSFVGTELRIDKRPKSTAGALRPRQLREERCCTDREDRPRTALPRLPALSYAERGEAPTDLDQARDLILNTLGEALRVRLQVLGGALKILAVALHRAGDGGATLTKLALDASAGLLDLTLGTLLRALATLLEPLDVGRDLLLQAVDLAGRCGASAVLASRLGDVLGGRQDRADVHEGGTLSLERELLDLERLGLGALGRSRSGGRRGAVGLRACRLGVAVGGVARTRGGRSLAARAALRCRGGALLGAGAAAGGVGPTTGVVTASSSTSAAGGHSVSSSGSCLLGILLKVIPRPLIGKPPGEGSYVSRVTEPRLGGGGELRARDPGARIVELAQ